MNELTIKSGGGFPTWLTIILVVTGVGGYIWGGIKTRQINNLRKDMFKTELEKFKPTQDSLESLEMENIITLDDIKAKQKELEKLERELSKQDDGELSLEDALKVIGTKK